MSEIKPINVPSYDELSVKRLYDDVIKDETLQHYFPDQKQLRRLPERDYFFTVINTIYPDYMVNIIEQAKSKRFQPLVEEQHSDIILMSQEWENLLKQYPFVSQSRGRTLMLLKKDSKMYKGSRNRKNHSLGMSLKRFKDQNGNMQPVIEDKEDIELNMFDDDSSQKEQNIGSQKMKFQI